MDTNNTKRASVDRRVIPDRREEIRFEPGKPPRRQASNARRKNERSAWSKNPV